MGEQVDARSNGDVAQLGEHLPCKQGVRSSNLLISTNDLTEIYDFVVGQVSRSFKSMICQKATIPTRI